MRKVTRDFFKLLVWIWKKHCRNDMLVINHIPPYHSNQDFNIHNMLCLLLCNGFFFFTGIVPQGLGMLVWMYRGSVLHFYYSYTIYKTNCIVLLTKNITEMHYVKRFIPFLKCWLKGLNHVTSHERACVTIFRIYWPHPYMHICITIYTKPGK